MEPEYPESIEEKAERLKIDLEFPEKHGFIAKPFISLDYKTRREVADFYSERWNHVLKAEHEAGIWKTRRKKISLKGKKISLKEPPLEDAIEREVWKQLHRSGRRFPKGHMVLLKEIESRLRPIVFTRSALWFVPDVKGEGYHENYPKTWYMVSENGYSHYWVPQLKNEKPEKFKKYKDILKNPNPALNEDFDLVLMNYALTGNPAFIDNPDERHNVKEAARAAVMERARFALKNGINHCDTFSPLNNYAEWASKKIEKHLGYKPVPKDFVEEVVLAYLNKKKKPGIFEFFEALIKKKEPRMFTAIGMHMHFGAKSMQYFANARIDPDSMNYCGVCRYF